MTQPATSRPGHHRHQHQRLPGHDAALDADGTGDERSHPDVDDAVVDRLDRQCGGHRLPAVSERNAGRNVDHDELHYSGLACGTSYTLGRRGCGCRRERVRHRHGEPPQRPARARARYGTEGGHSAATAPITFRRLLLRATLAPRPWRPGQSDPPSRSMRPPPGNVICLGRGQLQRLHDVTN